MATTSGSRGKKGDASSEVSRKTLRKTTAPMAKRAGGSGEDGKQPAAPGEAGGAPAAEGLAAESTAAAAPAEAAQADAAPQPAESAAVAETAPAPEAAPETPAASITHAAEQAAAPVAPQLQTEYAILLPPTALPVGDPNSPAPPPGKAPPGDSRSFRRFHEGVEEFVLLYRYDSLLITRSGRVGTLGTYKVVEYPHIGAAAHAYAHQCSNLTASGFRDLR